MIDNVQTTGNNTTTLDFEFPYFSSNKLRIYMLLC